MVPNLLYNRRNRERSGISVLGRWLGQPGKRPGGLLPISEPFEQADRMMPGRPSGRGLSGPAAGHAQQLKVLRLAGGVSLSLMNDQRLLEQDRAFGVLPDIQVRPAEVPQDVCLRSC